MNSTATPQICKHALKFIFYEKSVSGFYPKSMHLSFVHVLLYDILIISSTYITYVIGEYNVTNQHDIYVPILFNYVTNKGMLIHIR